MAKNMLKQSTLGLLSMVMTGMSQGVWAEYNCDFTYF
jgi:thimet oligopeptidase